MLRLFHLLDIFYPLKLMLEKCLMKNKIQKEIENMYSLVILFTGLVLFAHICACMWIFLGTAEDGFMTALMEEEYDGVWHTYGPREIYIFSLYWIFEVLTTVGYGDFSGSNEKEMLFSIFLEFGGLLVFSILTALLVELVSIGGDFNDMLYDYVTRVNTWVMHLEKANDNKRNSFMPPEMYRDISTYTEEAFRHDFNLIVEEASFY